MSGLVAIDDIAEIVFLPESLVPRNQTVENPPVTGHPNSTTDTERSIVALLRELGAEDPERLVAQLREDHARAETPYHSWRHILHGLSILFEYRDSIPDFDAALIAWLNHDRIYDAQRADNEDLSADLARQMCLDLGQEALADLTVELVLDTKHDREPRTETGRWIVGVDLAILGETRERYDQYETNIRREYAHVGDLMYRLGRGKVLRGFLKRDRIYDVPELNARYEANARDNLNRALNAL